MICPTCKTNNTNRINKAENTKNMKDTSNTNNLDVQYCAQCGSDLYVHHLLRNIGEEIQMKDKIIKTEQELQKKTSCLFVVFVAWQIVLAIFLAMCIMFGVFVGLRFLAFMDREESYRVSITDRSESRFEQSQQMNAIIKQGVNLILDQRRENQALQAKIQELTAVISKNTEEEKEQEQGKGKTEDRMEEKIEEKIEEKEEEPHPNIQREKH